MYLPLTEATAKARKEEELKQKEIAEIHKKIITIAGAGHTTTTHPLYSSVPSPSTPPSVLSPSGLFGNGKLKQEKPVFFVYFTLFILLSLFYFVILIYLFSFVYFLLFNLFIFLYLFSFIYF